jgi:UDPglucose 6-dehydrogenase
VVVDKSTVPVGTAKRVHAVIAKETTQPFSVVSNPEFLKQGAAVEDFMKPDRVVIGVDPGDDRAAALMKELYGPFTRTGAPIMMMDTASAELCKYAANSILASRISFMNEVANMCELVGADVDQVRRAIGADRRIGSSFLFPGVGYGGSCFPKDVKALIKSARDHGYDFKILHAVEAANHAQKERLVAKMLAYFGSLKGKTIAVWGLAFKPRTDDMREAPAIVIIEGLLAQGASVRRPDHVLRKELRCAGRRRRAGRCHRVEHVPRAGVREDAGTDAIARRVRRPQHLLAREHAHARLYLFLHWPVTRERSW